MVASIGDRSQSLQQSLDQRVFQPTLLCGSLPVQPADHQGAAALYVDIFARLLLYCAASASDCFRQISFTE